MLPTDHRWVYFYDLNYNLIRKKLLNLRLNQYSVKSKCLEEG